jgi:hypothetical protein
MLEMWKKKKGGKKKLKLLRFSWKIKLFGFAEKCGKKKKKKKKKGKLWNRPVRSKYRHWLSFTHFLIVSQQPDTVRNIGSVEKGLTCLLG